ncbi:hypothetical protein J2X68_007694 [Streptomyces sp. 3330]|uniref:hypothetical protein n=1 Tax=Streptomyces sp. 3330 TaxID=2817755 RepID=UPI0028642A97|nr:hypothetical protein [Streptomyces sp. 3330]MDR6980952.1 hypothetical protein [Streptomyces sp. 3330]
MTVPKAHEEAVVVDGVEHLVKRGVFLSNSCSRRGKLTAERLAALGLAWAGA